MPASREDVMAFAQSAFDSMSGLELESNAMILWSWGLELDEYWSLLEEVVGQPGPITVQALFAAKKRREPVAREEEMTTVRVEPIRIPAINAPTENPITHGWLARWKEKARGYVRNLANRDPAGGWEEFTDEDIDRNAGSLYAAMQHEAYCAACPGTEVCTRDSGNAIREKGPKLYPIQKLLIRKTANKGLVVIPVCGLCDVAKEERSK